MNYLVSAMQSIMRYVFEWTGNWGLGIIGLTVLVRVILLPLTITQGRSTVKMQAIQPEATKIQKKYKDDPERMNMEIMDLYQRNKISPWASCLPVVLQLPLLMGMIRALDLPDLAQATFLGFTLGQPGGWIMAIAAAATTFLSMKLSPTMGGGAPQQGNARSSQNMMMIAMMGMMFYFAFRYSSAVTVYIITANLAGLVERYFVPRPGQITSEGAGSGDKR